MTDQRRISKTLSYWLRHRPEAAGLELDSSGWATVEAVLEALSRRALAASLDELESVVASSDKNRFELSPDGTRIRARQGHSLDVDLDWPAMIPPALLFHGTVERFLPAILAEGLQPMKRHHVHLSPDEETARAVGSRRGTAVILRVAAGRMSADGKSFYLASNGVWLTDSVPPAYLERVT